MIRLFVFFIIVQTAIVLGYKSGSAELDTVILENKMHVVSSEGRIIYPPSTDWYQLEEIQPSTYRIITWVEGKGERCALYNAQTGLYTDFVYWQAYGADKENHPILVLDETGYYFINAYGALMSSQRYYHAQPFSCGLAWTVKTVDQEGMPVKEQAGFINTEGECVIPGNKISPYDEFFVDDRCLIFDHEARKYGYMNTEGEICIPPIYDYGEAFSCGYAYVELDGIAKYINVNGEFVIPSVNAGCQ